MDGKVHHKLRANIYTLFFNAAVDILILTFFAASLAGCNLPGQDGDAQSPAEVSTQAAQTVAVLLTEGVISATQPPTPVEKVIATATRPAATFTPTATLQPTNTPVLTPTQTLTPLLSDDFSAQMGWYTVQTEEFSLEYVDGGYRITIGQPFYNIWSVRGQGAADVIVEVLASRMAGPENGYYGPICRFTDSNNYYALVISSDGSYGIAKMADGEIEFLKEGQDSAGVIKQGNAVNQVRAYCIGSKLRLEVNGQSLIEVEDDSFPDGDIGLMAGTREQPGLQAWFDDFAAYKP